MTDPSPRRGDTSLGSRPSTFRSAGAEGREPRPFSPSLVVQTSFLGDMVLTTPLIAHLAGRGPVDVVATRAAAALLANNPDVREVVVYDKRGKDRGVAGFLRLAAQLRRGRYGAAFLAQGSLRSAALAAVARIPRRIGFASSAGRRLYTARVPYDESAHHAARLLSLATEALDSPAPESLRPRLYPGEAERAAVDALLGEHGRAREPFVALAPGSVWATKRWPYYEELARALAGRGVRCAVVGGPEDRELARRIAQAAGASHVPIDATGRLSLLGSAELIGRACAIVTNDSAPQHLASAMDTPTITVFGPTVAEFGFGPLAQRREAIGHEALDCRPCDRHGPRKCPLGHWRCMRELGPDAVVSALDRLLGDALPALSAPHAR